MKKRLDMKRIAAGLGADHRGAIDATSGYFGAMALLAEVAARFRTPAGGGRSTDPEWTEQRLVRLAPASLERLKELAAKYRDESGLVVEPMQLAALLLEKALRQLLQTGSEELLRSDALSYGTKPAPSSRRRTLKKLSRSSRQKIERRSTD